MEPGGEILLVHNPASRRGRRTRVEVAERLHSSGLAARGRWVSIGELGRLEPGRAPPERAVAVGGDGTVNTVSEWLLRAGHGGALLAIVPGGTGNNLARGLGIPRDRREAIAIALSGRRERRIDVVSYQPLEDEPLPAGASPARFIVQGGALGFPADVAARFAALRRRRLLRWLIYPSGELIYRILALAGLLGERRRRRRAVPPEALLLRAVLPGEVIEEEVLAVFIGNEPTLGGGFRPCPRAVVDDGLLDLCLVRAGTSVPDFRIFRAVARGEHLACGAAVGYRQTPGPLDLHLSRPSPLLADGDIWLRASAYRLQLLPGALRVAVGP